MKLLILTLASFVVCIKSTYSLDTLKIGEKNGGQPVITYNITELIHGIEDMLNDGTTITSVEIHHYTNYYYLVGTGIKNYNFVIAAFRLDENGDDIITYRTAIVDLHRCDGNFCSSCTFQKDGAGNITGCQCNSPVKPEGYCNHSVSQVVIEL